MSEPAKPAPLRLHERKEFLPIVIFVVLVGLVTLSSRLSGRPPAIDSISPLVGSPGEVMIITGRHFQEARGPGEVRIGAVSPHTDDYDSWTDTTIKLRIPDDTPSDVVTVRTRNGRSNGVFFTNRSLIPKRINGPAGPGEPYIYALTPQKASQGGLVTVTGVNFGQMSAGSGVYFTWGSAEAGAQADPGDTWVRASEQDGDYEGWSELEIRVRVPDGATSGGVLVATGRGRSNAVYFELEGGVGSKRYVDRRKYDLKYGVSISKIELAAGGGSENQLYVWVPAILTVPEQRKLELVSRVPEEPLFDDFGGLIGFLFQDLRPGASADIDLEYIFDRYAVSTNINPEKVDLEYDRERTLFTRFTAPDTYVPSTADVVAAAARVAVGTNKNPYWKARLAYNYVVARLAWDPAFAGDALAAHEGKKGDSLGFASLFVAMCRAADVPSRLVAGYLLEAAEPPYKVRRHYWAEFYVARLGWLPVDPVLGKGVRLIESAGTANPADYYFGSLDNRHLTLAKGEVLVPQQTPKGKTVQRPRAGGLQTIHEEASGSLVGYAPVWRDLEILGIY